MSVITATEHVENEERLDPVVERLRDLVRRVPPGRVRDLAHGVQLGHPLHPLLVQLPIGAWVSASILDLTPDGERAGRLLIGVGLAGAVPAALAGWLDWAEQHEQQMRVGLVHVAANVTAIGCYTASLATRATGRTGWGRALALAGLAAVGAGGWLGAHIAYRQAAGANHTEDVPHLVEPGWHPIGEIDDIPEGRPVRLQLGEVPVLVIRDAEHIRALADRCAHLSGPLSDGEVHEGTVTCPWHASTFRLSDGTPVRGPATAPQPVFQTRVRDGVLELRLPGAGWDGPATATAAPCVGPGDAGSGGGEIP